MWFKHNNSNVLLSTCSFACIYNNIIFIKMVLMWYKIIFNFNGFTWFFVVKISLIFSFKQYIIFIDIYAYSGSVEMFPIKNTDIYLLPINSTIGNWIHCIFGSSAVPNGWMPYKLHLLFYKEPFQSEEIFRKRKSL